jgi:hypothetical protein
LLKVKYIEPIYSYKGSLSFTVNVVAQGCASAVLTIDETIFLLEASGFTMI